jgi:predicted aconitase with swiveling domain
LESIRSGTAPAAIITTTPDFFFALASVVADELYSKVVPLLSLNEDDFAQLQTGDRIRIDVDGSLEVEQNQDGRSTPMHPV